MNKTALAIILLFSLNTAQAGGSLNNPPPSLRALQGTDDNNNGVRDNLEALLKKRYAGNRSEQKAATQVLKQMRNGLGATGSAEASLKTLISLNKAFDCMRTVMGLDRKITESEFLRNQMINTQERSEAWIAFMNMNAGQSVPIRFRNACESQQNN